MIQLDDVQLDSCSLCLLSWEYDWLEFSLKEPCTLNRSLLKGR